MKTPWLLHALWHRLIAAPRVVWILFMHGPAVFCWHLGCWNLVWERCHGTAGVGNGRMCKMHCTNTVYHVYWRTGCEKPAKNDLDARLNTEQRAREEPAWKWAKDVTPKQKTLKA